MRPDDVPALTLRELLPIVETLRRIVARNRDTETAELTASLIAICLTVAEQLRDERHTYTMTPKDYAERCDIPLRTVTDWCRKGKLNAIRDGRAWRIKDDRAALPVE